MENISRRTFLKVSGAGFAASAISAPILSSTAAIDAGQSKRPNIVIIMSDQHNAKMIGRAGNPVIQTPSLDSLADSGTLFSNCYCPYPLCVPSRMSFMTAKYPSEIASWSNDSILPSTIPTFAHSFGAGGYEAVLCGRMHFRDDFVDSFHGFEKRIYGDVDGAATEEILGSGSRMTNGNSKYAVEVAGYGRTGFDEFDEVVTQKACEFISARKDDERPYCLVVGLVRPHNPLICSQKWFDYYMDKLPLPEPVSKDYLAKLHPAVRNWRQRRGVDDLTPVQRQRGLAAYCGLVTELDERVGRICSTIRSSTQSDNTVIIYTSDHGDGADEHNMWWKLNFYEGSVRVPLIVSCPARFAKGQQTDAIVNLLDVGPTMLDIAGIEPMPDVSGKSFAGFLTGNNPADWPNETYAECIGYPSSYLDSGDKPSCMIRTGHWKLNYYHEFKSCQLFNLQNDPDELNDLAADPQHKQIVETCVAKIHKRWSAQAMLDGAAREKRALGLIFRCGHPMIPHQDITHGIPDKKSHNFFDRSQLRK